MEHMGACNLYFYANRTFLEPTLIPLVSNDNLFILEGKASLLFGVAHLKLFPLRYLPVSLFLFSEFISLI